MKCTILGTGPSEGVPSPLCQCEFCDNVHRTRPSLLVSKNGTNIIFDATPDIKSQVQEMNLTNIHSIFLTHFHFDHSSGVRELNNVTTDLERLGVAEDAKKEVRENLGKKFDLYCSPYTDRALRDNIGYAIKSDGFDVTIVEDGDSINIDGLCVRPFIAEHCRGYLGFKISDEEKTVVYHPDFGTIRTDVEFGDVDVLVHDAGALLGYEVHGSKNEFEKTMDGIDPDKIYFTNVSEHIAQRSSEDLRESVSKGNIVDDYTQI